MEVIDGQRKFAIIKYLEITLRLDKCDEILKFRTSRIGNRLQNRSLYHFESLQCDRIEAEEWF